ncbi:MAG TPA: histidinol-phosphatase [Gaiellaceae bacterium]|nr:histidinol-phosphatase [Gaiellaceae bacterium]
MIVDYHMHLRRPETDREEVDHSAGAIERYLETAAARGVDEIGFTEHVYYFRQTWDVWTLDYQFERCVYDLDRYCDVVLEAKRQGLPVKLGLEVDFVGERQEQLTEAIAGYPWDFLLGSVHWIDGLAVDQEPGLWGLHSDEEVWRRYVAAVTELAATGSVDVLAHLDLAKIFRKLPEPAVLAELHEQLADAARGLAVEISTNGLYKPVGELYPDPALLRACVGRGIPITIASDAHVPANVGRDFDRAIELARGAGCETVTVFEGRVRRQEPLD